MPIAMSATVVDLARTRRSPVTRLRDGSVLGLRPVRAGDQPALRRFLEGISADALRSRFFGAIDPDRTAASLADCSQPGDVGVVARVPGHPTVVAHAALYRLGGDRAEVAFLVTDQWQGRGLGSIMLAHLIAAAREQGIATLVAEVLPGNRSMLSVFERSGQPVEVRPGAHAVEVRIATAPLAASAARAA